TRNIQALKDKIDLMVEKYNKATLYIQEKTGYNQVLKVGGVLMGDYVVTSIQQQFRSPIISQTNGFIKDIDTFLTPGQIGLELGSDGMLTFDSNVFDEAIAEDYMGVLAIIGADKSGSSDSNTIEFYSASSKYTTAGTYDVQVEFDGSGNTTAVRIKLSTESSYRDMTFSSNIATGNSSFDDNGDPVYAENGLQLTIPTTGTPSATITATIRVKQGFTGAIEDALDKMLKTTTGTIIIDQDHVTDQIEWIQEKIDSEEERLVKKEEILKAKFARLEKTLAIMQNQMAALNFG
ncbi:MAG: flagellar filament capping protein FliD, partial [Planctomycetota bacterium]